MERKLLLSNDFYSLVHQIRDPQHFWKHGQHEGRVASPWCHPGWYREQYPDVASLPPGDTVNHMITAGLLEGRRLSPHFDPQAYLALQADLSALFVEKEGRQGWDLYSALLQHYVTFGLDEGRTADRSLCFKTYLHRYRDLEDAFGSTGYRRAATHWYEYGIREGRSCAQILIVSPPVVVDQSPVEGNPSTPLGVRNADNIGLVDMTRELLPSAAGVGTASSNGWTAFMLAAWKGHVEVVRALLADGIDVSLVSEHGWTALMLAAWKGHVEVVQELVAREMDVNLANDHGWTALMLAAWNGHVDVARELMGKAPDCNFADMVRLACQFLDQSFHR